MLLRKILLPSGVVILAAVLTGCGAPGGQSRQEARAAEIPRGASGGITDAGLVPAIVYSDTIRAGLKKAMIESGIRPVANDEADGYLDRLEAELREELENTGIDVTRNDDQIIVNLPERIAFDVDSPGLNADFFPMLDAVAQVIDEYDRTLVEIAGHTDSSGKEDENRALTEQRALVIEEYLVSKGIPSVRMSAFGLGEQFPVTDNATRGERIRNRRVELILVPLTVAAEE